ncbi:MAG: carboxypeptidase-like regulatory domain-containing protein [Candidatus Pedobacter colombiensis]|uniref:Carboxypeptidase-like regulatory domain-containing protein n=1 Tax=Candidatus Pedobacter colombiensis TaxID=3121371 RepID=A0AAJ6B7B3_9SPHI|nr:carboxypeptidase-like regulatory domain-containing protein [Pedobacter sp.]WEK19336.1 MAG: carboxypeptidase-like regulatory domain-containing protein [Pedobacter sp.]
MKKTLFVIFFILIFLSLKNSAQEIKIIVNENFNELNIEQLVKKLEGKYSVRFFYNIADFNNILFSSDSGNKSINQFLESLLVNTDIKYVRSDRNIFLTKDKEIKIEISPYFSNNIAYIGQIRQESKDEEDILNAKVSNKLYEIGQKRNLISTEMISLSGFVRNSKTGEPLPRATISIRDSSATITANEKGYFVINLPAGKRQFIIRFPGMQDASRQVVVYSSGKINFELFEQSFSLKEVNVSAERARNVKAVELGVNRLDIKSIKQVPVVFGEADILRVVLTLPGVKSVGEASTGFNVRGGSTDQNLVLLNDAPVFSPSHFFGFFSAFNPEIVKDIELYKSSIPQKYGGRLSSVLEVTNREGNKGKFTGSAGIGLLTSRINVEGPIDSGKTSFIFGGRTTYANWLLNLLPKEYKNSKASFYDLNLDINHKVNDKNTILLSTYLSADKFKLNSDTSYKYANSNISLKWKHIFSNKFYSDVMGSYSGYNYNVESQSNPLTAYNLFFGIKQINAKADFSYILDHKHILDFGINTAHYNLSPGNYTPVGAESLVKGILIENEKALETAVYIGDRFDVSSKLSINVGLRYSIYNYLGAKTINSYAPGLPVEINTITDTKSYGAGDVIKTYQSPEIRASFRYSITDNLSFKGGYNTLNQYIHLLSNSASISPTDIWKLSDPNIKPQKGNQLSFGIYKSNKSHTIEFSAEGYYKRMKDFLDYKSGATLVLNDHIETDVIRTEGKAYGAEFMIKKTAGSLNGWISYTYSRTLLRMTDASQGELINNGAYYPGNADKPHDFNFTGNYRFTHRYSISINLAYSTGRPITLPIAKYVYAGNIRVLYSDRNEYRIPDYFRSDISFNIEGNHKIKQLTHSFWTIGVYNLTGRQNAYSTYFASERGSINGYKLSIFATAIPFINYNIKF